MRLIVLNVIFILCTGFLCYSQYPTKKIFIENKNFNNSKIEYGNIIFLAKADTIVTDRFNYVAHGYYVIKNIEIKNDNEWLVFYHVNNVYKHNIFFISITKDLKTMQLLFAFKQYDELNPNNIFLENILFSEGTYFFDFVDQKIMSTPYGRIDERFGDFHLNLDSYKKFRVSKKIISEDELKKFIDNQQLKQPRRVKKILSVFKGL